MIQSTINQISPRLFIILINQLTTLFTIPWLAANLSLEMFGLIATSLIIIQFSWILIDWGGMNYSTEIWDSLKLIHI